MGQHRKRRQNTILYLNGSLGPLFSFFSFWQLRGSKPNKTSAERCRTAKLEDLQEVGVCPTGEARNLSPCGGLGRTKQAEHQWSVPGPEKGWLMDTPNHG